jgi:putative transcriptional regulator
MSRKPKQNYEFSGQDLIGAAKEGMEVLRAGKLGDLRTTTIKLPEPGPKLAGGEIREIRLRLGASQAVFARLLNIPKPTVIGWESGQRHPSGAALKLLHIARRRPEVLIE